MLMKTKNIIYIVFFIIFIFLRFKIKELFEYTYITRTKKKDGFGSQLSQQIGIWKCANQKKNKNKIKYVHRPILKNWRMENKYNEKFDDFINLKKDEWDIKDFDETQLEPITVGNNKYCKGNILDDNKLDYILLKKYNLTKKPDLPYYKNRFNIAIHIRRGDVSENKNNSWDKNKLKSRYTPNSVYVKCIKDLRKKYKNKNPTFHIFSEGEKKDFKELNSKDVILHLNKDIIETFHAFVKADLLVKSNSTFSGIARIYNKNNISIKDYY